MGAEHLASWAFIGVVIVIAINRFVLSFATSDRPGASIVYWAVQVLNVSAAIAVAVFGLPGFADALQVLNYFVAFVFVFHIVENYSKRRQERRPVRDWDRERALLRQRIEQGEDVGPTLAAMEAGEPAPSSRAVKPASPEPPPDEKQV